MNSSLHVVLSVSFVFGHSAQPAFSQSSPVLSKQAAAVKQKASRLAPQSPISVVRFDAEEEYGRFVSSDPESFTFYDIDQKINVTLTYQTVKKLKDGYGGYNHATQRHVDRRRNAIIAAVVVGGLAVLIGAAAASK